MLVPRCAAAEKGTAGRTLEVWTCLSSLNLVPYQVATSGKLSPIASMLPAPGCGICCLAHVFICSSIVLEGISRREVS